MTFLEKELAGFVACGWIDSGVRGSGKISSRAGSNMASAVAAVSAAHPGCDVLAVVGGRAGRHRSQGYQFAVVFWPVPESRGPSAGGSVSVRVK